MKMNKKVTKFMEEFNRFSPNQQPVDLDEEDPDEEVGIRKLPEKNSDVVYGRLIEKHRQNPIQLDETELGRDEILRAASEKLSPGSEE